MTQEVWKKFKCLKCDGEFLIETAGPYVGWRCKFCDFPHLFKRGQVELECNTLEEVVEDLEE